MKRAELKIETLPVSALKEYKNNARAHGRADLEAIEWSIQQFGFNDPIGVWSSDNVIVEGHGRLQAAKNLGITEVPVIRLDHMTDEERKAYALAHNKTAELSMWDFGRLDLELAGIHELDMTKLGFEPLEINKAKEWFENSDKEIDPEEQDEEYQEFIKKFEAKATTDDCYTPEPVYEAVADYVEDQCGLNRADFVRPFYPGGCYTKYKYEPTSVVVDNPPFSIFKQIVDFYTENGIKFFLFAPAMTILNYTEIATAIALQVTTTYENGANVATSFVTNLETDIALRSDPKLYKSIDNANKIVREGLTKQLPKYEYPDNIVTAANVGKWSKYGVEQSFKRKDCMIIRQLDEQKEEGCAIYGSGLLLSEKAAAEKAAAEKAATEKAAAEKAAARVWHLSDREREMVAQLGA